MNELTKSLIRAAIAKADSCDCGGSPSLTDFIRFTIDAAIPDAAPDLRDSLTLAIDAFIMDQYEETSISLDDL